MQTKTITTFSRQWDGKDSFAMEQLATTYRIRFHLGEHAYHKQIPYCDLSSTK
jgi:hypothetical protein